MLLVATIQLASFFITPISGHRSRSLVVKSVCINKLKQSEANLAVLFSDYDLLSRDALAGESGTKLSLFGIRGGAYEDYNESYGYNDEEKAYNDDYYQSSKRYEDDYYNTPRGADGYYDDEGRYYEDDRDREGSVSRDTDNADG